MPKSSPLFPSLYKFTFLGTGSFAENQVKAFTVGQESVELKMNYSKVHSKTLLTFGFIDRSNSLVALLALV